MARPKILTYTLSASVPNGICTAQTPSGAGALTIDGAYATSGVATLNYPRHLLITTSANDTTKTLTIVGTDRYGKALSYAVNLPNATTLVVPYNFLTVTSVTVSAATTGTITLGTYDSMEGPWIPLDWIGSDEATISVGLSTSANFTYTLQSTLEDVQSDTFNAHTCVTQDTPLTGTASAIYKLDGPLRAIRLKITSFVTGTATLTIMERVSGK